MNENKINKKEIKDELREIYKLTDFVNVIDGDRGNNYPKKEQMSKDGETLFLSASNITKNGFNKDDCNFISNEQSNKMSKGVVLPGDIVITSRGTVGNVAYFKDLYGFKNIRINSGMLILRVKDLELAPSIYQYLKSPQFTRNLELITSGSAQPQLTKSDVNKIKINSFNGGIKNAKNGILLSLIDDLIDNLSERINQKTQARDYYRKLILDAEVTSKIKLGDLCSISTGRRDANHGNPDGKYPFFTCSRNSSFIDTYNFDCDALLIAGNGDVGHIKSFNGKFDAYQRTYVLQNFKISKEYIKIILDDVLIKQLEKEIQASNIPYIKLDMLKNIVIPTFYNDYTKKIVDLITSQEEQINDINNRVNNLKQMKQYYLNVIFK